MKYDKKLSNDQTAVYIAPKRIIIGLRGTKSIHDLKADGSLLIDKLSGRVAKAIEDIAPRDEERQQTKKGRDIFKERVDEIEEKVKILKEKYPDKKIIFGSHSLGGSILKGVMERFKNDDKLSGHAYNSWIGSLKKDARVKDYNTPLDIVSTASGILHSIAHATEDNKVWGREKANELTFKELDTDAMKNAVRDISGVILGTKVGGEVMKKVAVKPLSEAILANNADFSQQLFEEAGTDRWLDAVRHYWRTEPKMQDEMLGLLLDAHENSEKASPFTWVNENSFNEIAQYAHDLLKVQNPELAQDYTAKEIKSKWLADNFDKFINARVSGDMSRTEFDKVIQWFRRRAREHNQVFSDDFDHRIYREYLKDHVPNELSSWFDIADVEKYLWKKPDASTVNKLKEYELKELIQKYMKRGLSIYGAVSTVLTAYDIFKILHSSENFKMDKKYEKILNPKRKSKVQNVRWKDKLEEFV